LYRIDRCAGAFTELGRGQVTVHWRGSDFVLTLDLNLSDATGIAVVKHRGRRLWLEGGLDEQQRLLPWTAQWSVCV
jgi:uncharacterized protein DUF3459